MKKFKVVRFFTSPLLFTNFFNNFYYYISSFQPLVVEIDNGYGVIFVDKQKEILELMDNLKINKIEINVQQHSLNLCYKLKEIRCDKL